LSGEGAIDFRFSAKLEAFRQEFRQFLAEEVTPEVQRETEPGWHAEGVGLGPAGKALIRKMGERGYLGLSWPKEHGGQEKSPLYLFILSEEMARVNAPIPGLTWTSVAPTLIRVGTEEQKREFLPRILRGEIEICLGYTEPGAGSDLASLQFRAEEDGDDFVLNGQKMFTSSAHCSDYVWLLARTDPDAPKHKGLSLFLVPLDSEGITIRPLWTIGDGRTNETFYDDVRVPRKLLIGEMNRGWYYAATALDFERVGGVPYNHYLAIWEALLEVCRETSLNDRSIIEDPVVREQLSWLGVEVEATRLFAYRTAWMIAEGVVPNYEASSQKVFATEHLQRMANAATQMLGLYGQLRPGSKRAPALGRFERLYRSCRQRTVSAGANEIQRNIIAQRGLGLPRS
jgi:alkylation response protein AidB-like acyl-CoA dehydrogenase